MPRYKITIEYNGCDYHGWQRQPNLKTVQSTIEKALYNFTQNNIIIHGACRTDAGVHAHAQIAHFDLAKHYSNHIIHNALNFYLKNENISILHIEKVSDDFHARFNAKEKTYIYKILNRYAPASIEKNFVWHIPYNLDVNEMKLASQYLIGTHDFSSFRAQGCQANSPVKTMKEISFKKNSCHLSIHLTAKSFLYNQIRIIVGTLKNFGIGKLKHNQMEEILLATNRNKSGITAPAHGLYLEQVNYH